MAYTIASISCTACGDCLNACPVPGAVVAGDSFSIDPEACIDCGLCVDGCPSASIYRPRAQTAALAGDFVDD